MKYSEIPYEWVITLAKAERRTGMKTELSKLVNVLRNQMGYNLIEFALTMGLVAAVVGGSFAAYHYRIAPAAFAGTTFDTFSSVWAGLQQAQNSRGGAFPAQATAAAITGIATVVPYIGTNSPDVGNWTYTCPSGNGNTITIVVNEPNSPSTDAMNMLRDKILNSVSNAAIATGSVSQTGLTVTVPAVNCS